MLSKRPSWVAIYTQSRFERKVEERLRNAGFETYLPLIEEKRKWSDRMKMVEFPLILSYVFAKITSTDPSTVRSVPGVVYIVSFRSTIETIPDEEIEAMRLFVDKKKKIYIHDNSLLKRGAKVFITEGEFAGMQGELIKDCKDGNFGIRIGAIGVSLVTEIDSLMLKPISEE